MPLSLPGGGTMIYFVPFSLWNNHVCITATTILNLKPNTDPITTITGQNSSHLCFGSLQHSAVSHVSWYHLPLLVCCWAPPPVTGTTQPVFPSFSAQNSMDAFIPTENHTAGHQQLFLQLHPWPATKPLFCQPALPVQFALWILHHCSLHGHLLRWSGHLNNLFFMPVVMVHVSHAVVPLVLMLLGCFLGDFCSLIIHPFL